MGRPASRAGRSVNGPVDGSVGRSSNRAGRSVNTLVGQRVGRARGMRTARSASGSGQSVGQRTGRSTGRSVGQRAGRSVGRRFGPAGPSTGRSVSRRVGPIGHSTRRSVNGSVGRLAGRAGRSVNGSVAQRFGWSQGRSVQSAGVVLAGHRGRGGWSAGRAEMRRVRTDLRTATFYHRGHRRGIGGPCWWASVGHLGASWGIGAQRCQLDSSVPKRAMIRLHSKTYPKFSMRGVEAQ